jgi:HPt (histidine-containing phosphotransfer) domain-containing protein
MLPDPFLERLAIVRQRFASTLEAKISETVDALPHLAANDNAAIEKLADTYQQIHKIVGIGPTVGFVATGQAARNAEEILITPFKSKRGLTSEEAARLQTAVDALQAAARSELQSIISKE